MLLQDFQPIVAIATTPTGAQRLLSLGTLVPLEVWIPRTIVASLPDAIAHHPALHPYDQTLRELLPERWSTARSLVFCLATGAVVRLIAPLLKDKATDPAVVVLDERGHHVISLCGGHQGGADRVARAIATALDATPVLTGGSNALDLPGIDLLGRPMGWVKGTGDWTAVSAAIARQQPVQVIQTAGSTLWQQHLPVGHSFQWAPSTLPPSAILHITPERLEAPPSEGGIPAVVWHPRVLWVGVGCERGTPRQVIETAIDQTVQAHGLAEAAIAGLATLDLKADEAGLLELCGDRQWPLRCFSADQLKAIPVPTPSTVVEAEVGTPSVAEAAALRAAMTHLESSPPLRVTKQILRLDGLPGAVTVAVAEAAQEFTGRTGHLWLVGTGPGDLNQVTPAARVAIAEADVVIGYSLYVDLVRPLLRPGQMVEALPITQERQRAQRAIELAHTGLTVAVISSGDCGIYGMAGLVFEELRAIGWNGQEPGVQVFPGISALQSTASRVGAPLMHDFCAISLSDLLTPWAVIETRLQAAAQADFVTALYNPKSKTRTEQIQIAQQIFLQYRNPDTPVAIARSVYRPDEQIRLTTLAHLLDEPIDMLTTVLIGNRSTQFHAGWMITPRGYLGGASG